MVIKFRFIISFLVFTLCSCADNEPYPEKKALPQVFSYHLKAKDENGTVMIEEVNGVKQSYDKNWKIQSVTCPKSRCNIEFEFFNNGYTGVGNISLNLKSNDRYLLTTRMLDNTEDIKSIFKESASNYGQVFLEFEAIVLNIDDSYSEVAKARVSAKAIPHF